MSWLKEYRKWRQRDFLKWRDDLSDYERDFFLPEIKGRCEALLLYCKEIDLFCIERADEHNFGVMLRKLMLPADVEALIPADQRPSEPKVLAKKYFSAIQKVNKETFIEPLENVIQKINSNVGMKEFGLILNEVNLVCSSVIQIKEKLFLYRFGSIAFVKNPQTGEVILTQPNELNLMLHQFQNTIDNIYGVANSTSGTLHQWQKEAMEWKTEFLKVTTERIAQRNNLLAIIAAIAISWAFMFGTEPLEKYQLEKNNDALKGQIAEDSKQRQLLEEQIKNLNLKVEDLKKSIPNKSAEAGK
ncbi:hypothetical protein [Bdellovibrio sp. HCB337]|uniref:hypothetical protein n=1 Tax=Bdellovibrio sp. HCB337 TaxID=3394358 RepID=UPI0039A578E2